VSGKGVGLAKYDISCPESLWSSARPYSICARLSVIFDDIQS